MSKVFLIALLISAGAYFSLPQVAVAITIRPSSPSDPEPQMVMRMGRYVLQPSWSSDAKPEDPPVAAFDFSGVTAELAFTATTDVKVKIYQVFKKSWKGNETNVRFNATLFHRNAVDRKWWQTIDHTIVDTRMQTASSHPRDPTTPLTYTLFTSLNASRHYGLALMKITEPDVNRFYPRPNFVELHYFTLENRHEHGPHGPHDQALLAADPSSHTTLNDQMGGVDEGNDFSFVQKNHSSQILTLKQARQFTRRIEFIGDSITCGYCNLCKTRPDHNMQEAQSFALSWANLACHALGADCHTVAWSGIGIARNVCGPQNCSTRTMADIYNKTLSTVKGDSSLWDFQHVFTESTNNQSTSVTPHGSTTNRSSPSSTRLGFRKIPEGAKEQSHWDHPQVVVINLGTNDFSINQSPNVSKAFVEDYLMLVHQVLRQYSSKVKIFVACGPNTDSYCPALFEIIVRAKQLFNHQLIFLDQRSVLTQYNQCCGHPSAGADAVLSRITTALIEAIMGWF